MVNKQRPDDYLDGGEPDVEGHFHPEEPLGGFINGYQPPPTKKVETSEED